VTVKFLPRRIYQITKLIICFTLSLGICHQLAAQDPGWPREITHDGATIIYYQPQVDAWRDFSVVEARMAISVTPVGGKATPGVVSMRAQTYVDRDRRMVLLSNLELTDTRFPSEDASSSIEFGKLVQSFLNPQRTMTISLDRLLAMVAEGQTSAPAVAVDNKPPKIFVSWGPAVLLLVDGEPIRAAIEKTKLEFVVNANWTVLFDTVGKKYFLLNDQQWLTAAQLAGPWTAATTLPKEFASLPADDLFADARKAVPLKASAAKAPKVFYSNVPAEVIEFKGTPVYVPIPGTQLTYATNTKSSVFVQADQKQYYFLVSGRWFRSASLNGPWTYAGGDLPADFAKIPPRGPGSDVLASIPGTQQAQDAVLLAQIPTTATVNIKEAEARVKVQYDGAPQFSSIATTPLSYATNSPDKIIKSGDIYYLCFQAVWFMSTSPNGPWTVASTVPSVIYTIPPSSPVYNVTYVTQVVVSPYVVRCSYTTGYMGVFVVRTPYGVTVVYGSGYYYPPYYYRPPYGYPIYRCYPVTYGVGAFYHPYSGTYGVARGAYGPYGGVAGAAWYNPSTGRYGRAATVYGPNGSTTVAGSYNPYTGVSTGTRQSSNAYGQWGSSVAVRGDQWAQTGHSTTAAGTVAGFRTSEGAKGAGYNGVNGSGFVAKGKDDNLYAGKDGNVYRKDSSGSWQKYDNGGWTDTSAKSGLNQAKTTSATTGGQAQQRASQNTATRPSTTQQPARQPGAQQPSSSNYPAQQLNRDADARQQGAQRTQPAPQANRGGGQQGGRSAASGGGGRKRS